MLVLEGTAVTVQQGNQRAEQCYTAQRYVHQVPSMQLYILAHSAAVLNFRGNLCTQLLVWLLVRIAFRRWDIRNGTYEYSSSSPNVRSELSIIDPLY
jgi:hypothetical protein